MIATVAVYFAVALLASFVGASLALCMWITISDSREQRREDAADSALARDKFGPMVGSPLDDDVAPLDDDLAIRHAWSQWSRGGTR